MWHVWQGGLVMSGNKRRRPNAVVGESVMAPTSRRSSLTWPRVVSLVAWVVLATSSVFLFCVAKSRWKQADTHHTASSDESPPESLGDLLAIPPEALSKVDVARMNLLCGLGLPGAENLNIAACLTRLDQWADHVRSETLRHLYQFRSNPGNYNNSEGYFRMLMLVTVLQQDFGVRYNPNRIREVDFKQSKDLFLHGLLGDGNGGTCVSLPVLYTAVARRLGYPVRLALTNAHVFCRWDSPADRFNIEATNQGMNSFPDEYYKTWPEKLTDAQVRANRYLLSLSPAEELACFLASRGHCLLDTGHPAEALAAYAAASALDPASPAYASWVRQAQASLGPSPIARRQAVGTPPVVHRSPMLDVQEINEMNRRRMEQATRLPATPAYPPARGGPPK